MINRSGIEVAVDAEAPDPLIHIANSPATSGGACWDNLGGDELAVANWMLIERRRCVENRIQELKRAQEWDWN